MSNYTLDIISHHPKFDSKSLRKYYVDGIETVGAWGDEPFEIRFKNNTWKKVQIKLSVDGTDVLSGKPATTDVDKNMWVVNAYGTMSLKAWPEDNNGGAAFVFTSANNSVAVHTHGDLSSRGIIAAAVYEEGHVEPNPIVITSPPIVVDHHHHHYYRRRRDYWSGPTWIGGLPTSTCGGMGGVTYTSNVIPAASNAIFNNSSSNVLRGESMKCSLNDGSATYDSCEVSDDKSLESLVSVGAGQHVDQKITYVTGLIKPTLSETVRVRYLWWDDLQAKLREANVPAPHADGFPGNSHKKNIDLKGTPRIGSFRPSFPREQAQAYSRV